MTHIIHSKDKNVKPLVNVWSSLFILVFLVIFIVILRQVIDALGASKRLDNAADEVYKLQEEGRRLKDRLKEVESDSYLEEIARNKLNLAKKDETIVIIDKELLRKTIEGDKKPDEQKLPNWQGWLKLFFK